MKLQEENKMKLICMYMFMALLIITPTISIAGDGHAHDDHEEESTKVKHDDHGDEDEHEDKKFVEMSSEELAEFGVELSTVGPGVIHNEIVVPGEISVNRNSLAHITPRFTGMITEVRANIGDKVNRGDILAVVESNESLTPYNVKSLISGMVIDKHATIGEVLTDDVPAFLVANLDTVWVNLSIYQMYLPLVKIGQRVVVALGHGQESQEGTISYISPLVDEHTRTATARVVLDNKSGDWRPGLLIEGILTTEITEVSMVIPKTALQQIEGTDVVFVKTEEGFAPKAVVMGLVNHTSVEIIHGLEQGQTYVSKGGFTLKSELQKGSFGEGHSH